MWLLSSPTISSRPSRSAVPAGSIKIGSGRADRLGVAPKGAMLDRAAGAGLDVPEGFIIPNGVEATAPEVQGWCAERGIVSLAVRSAFGLEDGSESSYAGWFETELGVDPGEVPAAVERVRASGRRHEGTPRLDVVVMRLVDARHAGVAFSEPGTYDDLVNVTDGLADRMVGGQDSGRRLELPRIESVAEGWQRRLQQLLAEVRSAFGDKPWDVEWADDGSRCWLLQLRPITAPTLRNETMTLANHAEILPALPSHLMTSVIETAGPDLFDWYRKRVRGLPDDRDFLHVVAGRPMINLSLLEDMMRHLGLPTSLVARSIGGGAGTDRPLNPGRALRSVPSLLRLGWAQIWAVVAANRIRTKMVAARSPRTVSIGAALDDLHDAYVSLVTGMFPLSSAIGPPMALLRASGTLYEHASRHRTVTAEMADRLSALSDPTRPDHAVGQPAIESFLADFGHRGVYESDIARPRYRDLPDFPSTLKAGGRNASVALPRRTIRGVLTWPLWLLAARPLAAREMLRHEAMRRFARIRSSLTRAAGDAVQRGQLRHVDDLWLLTVDEARQLDAGWTPDVLFWETREAEREHLASLDVPHVVGRFDDPEQWATDPSHGSAGLRGLPLTTGVVEGKAWVLDEPSTDLPDGFDPGSTVLVARSLDAGWIETLRLVAGVVAEIGGDLSHGSILVRELGLPAVTNVTGSMRSIRTGDPVRLRAESGVIDLI